MPRTSSTEYIADGVAGPAAAGRRLRLLLCVDSLAAGGTELNAVRTVEQLRSRGHDARLLVLRAEGPLLERCREASVPVVAFGVPPIARGGSFVRAAAFIRLLRRLGTEVVHTQDRYTNAFLVPWARLAGARVVASRRWWNVHPSWGVAVGNRLAFRLAHRVVANSGRVADLVARLDGVVVPKVAVVTNFLDAWAVAPVRAEDRAAVRSQLGIPAGPRVVGVVANLRPVKAHAVLLEAMTEVMRLRPDVMLALIGDGECRPALDRQAREAGIIDRTIFAGGRTGPVNWHAAFDVSVLSSVSEGFPNTVVEAMAAGNPVVATDVGGTADAIRDGESGVLVPAGAAAPLAAAIGALLDDPARAARMGTAARQRALFEFQADVVIPKLELLYSSLLTERTALRP
jgi:glycosyltransferase involved in cell wall biosynthesis